MAQPAVKCRCHSSEMYATLSRCYGCGHWSMDDMGTYKACERRKCGYEWRGLF